MLKIITKNAKEQAGELARSLDELAQKRARRMLAAALKAEAAAYVERFRDEQDPDGRALVVHNDKARPRRVTVGSGTLKVTAPRINDRRIDTEEKRKRFTNAILPPYMRHSPKVAEMLPILYLRDLSTGDFRPALKALLEKNTAGLSSANITRLLSI